MPLHDDRPRLHRLIAAGHLRYWIIASWALALLTTTDWKTASIWFAVATAFGLVRTFVEGRAGPRAAGPTRLKLMIATASCAVWAAAPWLSFTQGSLYGVALGMALLTAGYVLVFTQMRAAPQEALIVSTPYSIVVLLLIVTFWGSPGFWVILAVIPVLGLALLIKVVITQMKDAELGEVNRRQAALIVELEAARDKADAANAAKSRFLGVISHELRTPMNGVLGAAELLKLSSLDARQSQFVDLITGSGQNLLALLNDILDMTKIEAGKMTLAPTLSDTAGLAGRLTGPFAAQAEAKGLGFHTEVAGDWPAVMRADILRLSQISHNLLANAIKFTPTGWVRLRLVGARSENDRLALRLEVEDTGIGIARDQQDRLFQPFSQIDDSSTRNFGGTGLGLNLCKRLADLMGSEVSVVSTPGQGSIFSLQVELDGLNWPEPQPGRRAA
ncbi:ATP-binding protein [Brevundimonas sp.]|jgi:signal transduction histidine kinase|uniref:ATP-binding protein n=1 Tax=Brevundimonas sp. TaxID=1871086 RepID=UPI0037BFB30F